MSIDFSNIDMNKLYFNVFPENSSFTFIQWFLWLEALYNGHSCRKYENQNDRRLKFINDSLVILGFETSTHDELAQIINNEERINMKDVRQLIVSILYLLPLCTKITEEKIDELKRVIDNLDIVENTYNYYRLFQTKIGISDFRMNVKFLNNKGQERILDLYFINSREEEFYASLYLEKKVSDDRLKIYTESLKATLKQKTNSTLFGKPIPRNINNVKCLVILPYENKVIEV